MDDQNVGSLTQSNRLAADSSQFDDAISRSRADSWNAATADAGGTEAKTVAADEADTSGSTAAGTGGSTAQAGQPSPAKEPPHSKAWDWLHNHGLAKTQHEQAQDLRRYYSSVVVTNKNGDVVDTSKMSDNDLLALNKELRGQPVWPPLAAGAGAVAGPDNPAGLTRAQQGAVKKVDNIIDNGAKPHDFEGVRKELKGIQTGYDHITEMRNNVRGLSDATASLRGSLNNPNLPPAARAEIEAALGRGEATLTRMQDALAGK